MGCVSKPMGKGPYELYLNEIHVIYGMFMRFRSLKFWIYSIFATVAAANLLHANLYVENIIEAYGESFEKIDSVPGRPWVETMYRYQIDGTTISCYFVGEQCLWIDFFVRGKTPDQEWVMGQLEKIFPEGVWISKDFHGKPRWFFNQFDDRVTLRASGFTLHMNDYIRNLLSRREQWQF